MRNIPLLILSCLFIYLPNSISQKSFSVNAGLNVSHAALDGLEIDDLSQSVTYLFFGINSTFKIKEKWDFSTDLDLIQKGFKTYEPASKSRYHYIDINPQIQYEPAYNLTVGLGPSLGIAFAESLRNTEGTWINITEFNTIDTWSIGAKLNIRYTINNVYFRFAASKGFNNISNLVYTDQNGNPIGNATQKNLDFQFGIGYLLHNKHMDSHTSG